MKKLYIIHRWDSNPAGEWYPWLKKNTEDKFEVHTLKMPNPHAPKIEEWVECLQKNIQSVDKDTYFVGHSIGCQTILRYLETLPDASISGGTVFVTPWVKLTPAGLEDVEDIAKPWIETPINWEKAKKQCQSFAAIFSDNDPYVGLENVAFFKGKLNATVYIEHEKGHMTTEDGVTEAPEILRALLAIADVHLERL